MDAVMRGTADEKRTTAGDPPRQRTVVNRDIKTPMDRPDWWTRAPELPWYKTITRQKALIIAGIILVVHVPFGIGFFQDMKTSRIQMMRKSQKVLLNYHQLYPCFGPRVDGEALQPAQALASPEAVSLYKLSGTVGLGVTLKPDGTVAGRCLAESSGLQGLDNAVYAASRDWKFIVPANSPSHMRLLSLRFDGKPTVSNVRAWAPPQKIVPQKLPLQK
jgi:TonB family protein